MDDIEVKTPEDIARHYSAALDSVALLNAVAADPDAYAENERVVERNVEHLQLVVGWDFWTDEDLTPFNNAIEANT